ncbi:hypothetical protein GUJ93_ZPchr0007g6087 [Zizania palustris]|uniref:Secreted protein n=1 Tax=Zizania palustris TaxID=103762 RepID=A0A8J5VR64_ZIZPA|nr:hypothetical protein GUJ93_ZPchr0007g6087 [Zizania palustris]
MVLLGLKWVLVHVMWPCGWGKLLMQTLKKQKKKNCAASCASLAGADRSFKSTLELTREYPSSQSWWMSVSDQDSHVFGARRSYITGVFFYSGGEGGDVPGAHRVTRSLPSGLVHSKKRACAGTA